MLKQFLSILLLSFVSSSFAQDIEHQRKQFEIGVAFAQLTNENLKVKDSISIKNFYIYDDNYYCMTYRAKNEYGVSFIRDTILTPSGKIYTSSSNPDSVDFQFYKLWDHNCVRIGTMKNLSLAIGAKTGFKVNMKDNPNYLNSDLKNSTNPNILLKEIINNSLESPVSDDHWFPNRLCDSVASYKLIFENNFVAHYQVTCSNYKNDVLLDLGNIPAIHSTIISCKFSKIEMTKETQCKP